MKYNKDDVYTILVNAQYQLSINYSPFLQGDVIKDTSTVTFVNNQVNSLRKLYVQLSPKDKLSFIDDIQEYLDIRNNISTVLTVYNFLIHNGQANIAFKSLSKEIRPYNYSSNFSLVCSLISEIIKNEWIIVPKNQIEYLYKWADNTLNGKNELGSNFRSLPSFYASAITQMRVLHRKLNIVKMLDLNERIFVGTNDEINTDEKALKNEFKKFNFPDDLSEALDKIDLKISTANDNFDFKGVIDLIRSFTERLFQHIAITIDGKNGRDIDVKNSEKVSKYFIEKQLISDDQGKMIVALRHFLSNEGVHRLKSRPDDARLSRNMTIEMALYLIFRLNDITNK